jgi:hypothetical protein
MILPRFGGPDVFELRDLERPRAGAGELVERVIASERLDSHHGRGKIVLQVATE